MRYCNISNSTVNYCDMIPFAELSTDVKYVYGSLYITCRNCNDQF